MARHSHALAAQSFEQALRFEQAISARDRHRIDRMKFSHVADRRQQIAGYKLPAGDQATDLLGDLPEYRLRGRGLNDESGCVHVYQCTNTRNLIKESPNLQSHF